MLNSTNVSSLIPNHARGVYLGNGQSLKVDSVHQLGYDLGKIARTAFDQLYNSWQKLWITPLPSQELAERKITHIYRKGLKECVQKLEMALTNLQKNPYDKGALKKFKSLASYYASYLKPHDNQELQKLQQKLFRPLSEKISKLPYSKEILQHLLPFYLEEDKETKTKTKRMIQQASSWPASIDLAFLNGMNGFKVEGLAAGDLLGASVSTVGDLNGDGKDELVLGAYGTDSGGRGLAGAAYVLFGKAGSWPASFDLAFLNGTNGFKVEGLAVSDQLGVSVSTAGDLNGDGKDELILGAFGASPEVRIYAGSAYIIFGKVESWPASFNLTTLNGTNGFKVEGLIAGDHLGISVSTAGDLNEDGLDELVLGAYRAGPGGRANAGIVYILFGTSSWSASFNLASLNGTNGFKVEGLVAGDNLGWSVSTAGDLNGDGKNELVLGALYADPGGQINAGTVYVLFGASNWSTSFNLTILNGTNGFIIEGLVAGDSLGYTVSTAGDLNGDGKDELILGAYWANSEGRGAAGTAYVLFGKEGNWPTPFNLTSLNGTNGFKVGGLAAGDHLGVSANIAGDLNGDGLDEIVLGAHEASPGSRIFAGTAYVLFGQANNWPASFNLTTLNGTNGFKVEGLAAGDKLGGDVNTVRDLNGDGLDELVLGAPYASPGGRTEAGAAYIIFGRNVSTTVPSATIPPLPSTTPSSSVIIPTSLSPSFPMLEPIFSPPIPNKEATSSPDNTTFIGIGAGIGGAVFLGGIIATLLILKRKKKGCFAQEEDKNWTQNNRTLANEVELENKNVHTMDSNQIYMTELPQSNSPRAVPSYDTNTYAPSYSTMDNTTGPQYKGNDQTMFGV